MLRQAISDLPARLLESDKATAVQYPPQLAGRCLQPSQHEAHAAAKVVIMASDAQPGTLHKHSMFSIQHVMNLIQPNKHGILGSVIML